MSTRSSSTRHERESGIGVSVRADVYRMPHHVSARNQLHWMCDTSDECDPDSVNDEALVGLEENRGTHLKTEFGGPFNVVLGDPSMISKVTVMSMPTSTKVCLASLWSVLSL